jgi:hypothetical protein
VADEKAGRIIYFLEKTLKNEVTGDFALNQLYTLSQSNEPFQLLDGQSGKKVKVQNFIEIIITGSHIVRHCFFVTDVPDFFALIPPPPPRY